MTENKNVINNISLLSICILFTVFTVISFAAQRITLIFLIIQLFSLFWLVVFVAFQKMSFFAILPILFVSPLLVLQLQTFNSLALYHIIEAVFFIHIFIKIEISLKNRIIMYTLFSASYISATYLHLGFSVLDMAVYGGVLMHLLILCIGIITYQRDENEKELVMLRSKLLNLKDDFKDKEQDPLMGIFSKSGGMKVLKQTMKWSQRYEIPLTVCYMELNNSRDDYIHSITRRIVNRVRESDTLFRLGKSEILLILPDCQKNDAASVMKSIQEILLSDKEVDAVQFGLADFTGEHKTSPNELIINANMAIA